VSLVAVGLWLVLFSSILNRNALHGFQFSFGVERLAVGHFCRLAGAGVRAVPRGPRDWSFAPQRTLSVAAASLRPGVWGVSWGVSGWWGFLFLTFFN
jgi:hypothetical protein